MITLTAKNGFDDKERKKVGPPGSPEVVETERHVYICPFNYTNVEIGEWYEYGDKGMEFVANRGFITIRDEKPIVQVNVVGSGCVPEGYNICEWWDDGEDIDHMHGQLVKRQRTDHLNGTHPSIWSLLLMGKAPGRTFESVGEMKDAADCLKKLSAGFYEGVYLGFYENVASFRPGPPYPRRITIRSGCRLSEDPGTNLDRYPGDYAIRVVETIVVK